MSLLRVDNVGAMGFTPDIEAWQLPANGWTDLKDVSLSENSLRPPYLTQELFSTAGLDEDTVFIGSYMQTVAGATWLILCTAERVYATRGKVLQDITPANFTFSADLQERWQFTSFNGYLIVNTGKDEPHYWPITSTDPGTPKLKPLSQYPGESPWEENQTCAFIVGFKSALFAGNIQNNSGTFPYLVIFSDFAEPGTLPQQWYPTPSNSAGSRDIAEGLDEIVTGLPFKDVLLIRKENSVIAFTFRGGQFVYDRRTVAQDTACLNKHSVVNSRDFQVAVGQSDIYFTQGGEHKSAVKNRTKNWFFDNLNIQARDKVFCGIFSEKSEIWIFAAHGDSEFCNVALIWNYDENTFTTRTCEGYIDSTEGKGLLPDGFVSWENLC